MILCFALHFKITFISFRFLCTEKKSSFANECVWLRRKNGVILERVAWLMLNKMLTNVMIYFINSFENISSILPNLNTYRYLFMQQSKWMPCNMQFNSVSKCLFLRLKKKNIERRICNEYCCFLLFICILQILQQINNEIMKEILCVFFFLLCVDWSQESAELCGQCYKSLKGASTEKIKKLFFVWNLMTKLNESKF